MDLDELALRVAVLKDVQERVAAEYERARMALTKALGPHGRKVAVVDTELGDYELATATVTKRRVQVDTTALLPWVRDNYPTEVETETVIVTKIRPAFLDQIKKASERAGYPCTPDGTMNPPGVSLAPGTLTVRPADGSADVLNHLWNTGALRPVSSFLEIT